MTRATRCVGILGLILFVGCNGCGGLAAFRHQADFRQTADLEGVRQVIVETRNGAVEVRCEAAKLQADIAGTKFAQGISPEAARERVEQIQIRIQREAARPEVLHVEAVFPPLADGSAGVSFRLGLPAELALKIRTGNGAVTATGTHGDVDAESRNGRIGAEDIYGNFIARTSNGEVSARRITGSVEAVSSNGAVFLEEIGGARVAARTSNGRVRAIGVRGEIELASSNGAVDLKADSLPPRPRVRIRTSNGAVHAEVPRTANAALRLVTRNGRLHTDLAGAQMTDYQGDKDDLSATLNGGGGLIDVETSNGQLEFSLIDGRSIAPEAPAASSARSR